MSNVAFVPRDTDSSPRAKALPLKLFAGGAEPPDRRLPADLVFRRGARKLYFRCPSAIRAVIADACAKIGDFFGASVQIALDRFVDAEDTEADALLYIVIGTQMGAAAAGDALDRFQEEWWLDNVERGQDKVHVSLELL